VVPSALLPPDPAAQQLLLRPTLPDAQVAIVQERSPKARHGRREVRTLWTIESPDLNGYLGSAGTVGEPWPGVAQALRLQRDVWTKEATTGVWQPTSEVEYGITSRSGTQTDAPGVLLRWRVHWHIENRLHWTRDVTLGEDASQIHDGQAPTVFATLRNAAVTLLTWGQTDRHTDTLAATQRDFHMAPAAVLQLFTSLTHRLHGRVRQ
jgi:hypothetical protein